MLNKHTNTIFQVCGLFLLLLFVGLASIAMVGLMIEAVMQIRQNLGK